MYSSITITDQALKPIYLPLSGTGRHSGSRTIWKKYIDNTNSFYYGFIDLEAFKQSGFALPPPTPGNPPVIDLYGGGGGVRINMRSVNPVTELKLKKDSENAPTNDCPIPDAKYLAPGVGFSQNYAPEKGTYGGNFYLILDRGMNWTIKIRRFILSSPSRDGYGNLD
jgi:hypothetical protein